MPRRTAKLGDRWAFKLKVPSNTGNLQVDVKCHFEKSEQRADHKCMHIPFKGTIAAEAVPADAE